MRRGPSSHAGASLAGCVVVAVAALTTLLSAAETIDFQQDIAPIFEERCWHCHGEDEAELGLRLDRQPQMLRGGDSGLAAIVPGKPAKSYLLDVVKHLDQEMPMPPDDDQLAAEEIASLEAWIEQHAQATDLSGFATPCPGSGGPGTCR